MACPHRYVVQSPDAAQHSCTPGFVVATKVFLEENPNPTMDQVKDGLGGNLCRCGTYVGVRQAVIDAAKGMGG